MSIVNDLDLAAVKLLVGGHSANTDGEWCLLEAVAYVAGEPWSDHPKCVSPVLAAFGRSFNDNLDDEGRQKLAPFIPRLIGTNTGAADEDRRAWLICDWMLHIHLPTWLDAADMAEQAAAVRALPTIESWESWEASRAVVHPIRATLVKLRQERWEAIRAKVREHLRARPDAVAVADAAADAAAVADAVADVVAVAAADAVAVAVAVAGAVADDSAYMAAKKAALEVYRKAIAEHPTLGPTSVAMKESGFALLDQLCEIGKADG